MTNDISSKAMLVYLSVSAWSGRKLDRSATQEVTQNHEASSDAGRFNKQLLPKDALAPLVQIAGAARTYLYDHTLAWSDNGDRVMSSDNYFAVMERLRKYKAEFTATADKFCEDYDTHRERARLRLNTLFNDNDYPHSQDVRRKFDMRFGVMPLPSAGDFRVDLSEDELNDARAEIAESVNSRVQGAMLEVTEKIRDALKHLHQRLDETKGGTGRLHESALTNIEELLSRIPGLNLTNDAGLEDLRKTLATTFNGLEIKDIKKDDALRNDVMRQTDEILKNMQGVCC